MQPLVDLAHSATVSDVEVLLFDTSLIERAKRAYKRYGADEWHFLEKN